MTKDRLPLRLLSALCILPLASCTYLSASGPQKGKIENGEPAYVLVPVKSRADLPPAIRTSGSGRIPPRIKGSGYSDQVRERDVLRFIITDLSAESPFFTRNDPFNFGPLEVPQDGRINVPYVGDIQVLGQSLADISSELNTKLKPISKTAQAAVVRSNRIPRTANVLGEVRNPGPVPLERANINSLDLLAASGGPKDAEHRFNYTLRRNDRDYTFDYQGFRKRPFQIEEGDLLTVTTDVSNRFYLMGAINRPTTVPFPVPAPNLIDALGAAGGLDERRSDASGVFIFRKGEPDLVYTINLKDPAAMLLTQRFPVQGGDIIYVTEAPLSRWNRLIQQVLPISQLSQAAYNLDRISNP